jgi:hypothetical protein
MASCPFDTSGLDRELAGDQRGAHVVAVFEYLEQVTAALLGERGGAKIIEHAEVGAGELPEKLGVAAIALGDGELLQKAGET